MARHGAERPPSPPPGPTAGPHWFLALSLALFAASRVAVLRVADAPVMSPDEPGAWAIAQWLSGSGGTLQMFHMPRYPLASGVVLAPLWWLPVSPATRYQLGLVVAAALVLCAAWLVRSSLRHLGAGPWPTALGTAVVLLVPSTSFATGFTYAEPTVLCCWAVLLWGLGRLRDRWTPSVVALTAVAAGAAPFVHGRLSAVPVIWCCFVVWSARHERRAPRKGAAQHDPAAPHERAACQEGPAQGPGTRSAVAAVGITAAVMVVGWVLQRSVTAALWIDPEPALKGEPRTWLADPGAWSTMLRTLLGQLWYAVAASAGLAAAGVAALVRELRRSEHTARRAATATFAAMLAANLASSAFTIGGYLQESGYRAGGQLMPPRFDHLVYGRYNDAAIVLLSCLGLVWCWERAGRRALSQVLVASAAVLVAGGVSVQLLVEAHPELLRSFPTPNVAGLSGLVPARGTPSVASFTAVALLTVAVVLLAALRDRRSFGVVIGAWLVLGALAGTADAVRLQSAATPVEVAAVLGPADTGRTSLTFAHDAWRSPGVVGNWLPGLYGPAADGWSVRGERGDSSTLASAPPTDTGALVLVEGVRPGPDWIERGADRGVVLWQRLPS